MRLSSLFAVLLACSAHAQVVPITGRVSAPVSAANAGSYQAPGAGPSLSPDAGAFLPPALNANLLGAPAVVSREAAAVQTLPAAVAAAAAVESKTKTVALAAALSAASKDAGDKKNDEPASEPASAPKINETASDHKTGETESGPKTGGNGKGKFEDGGFEDGRAVFDGAKPGPNDAVEATEPTEAELEAAFGARKPLYKTVLRKFGVAGALLAANSIAYAAVPNDGTETGTLARLAFDSQQFLTAVKSLSVSGLAESAWRALTSMFMHANDGHIFGNMTMLLLFTPWVQSALGGGRTMVIYLAGGVAATVSYALLGPAGIILGASAAISALMGAALTVWSKPKDGELFDLYRVCFQAFAAVMIGLEVKSLILQGPVTPDHVVTLAHVVGAGMGLIIGGLYALGRARRNARERAA